jgi:hypothetical protein
MSEYLTNEDDGIQAGDAAAAAFEAGKGAEEAGNTAVSTVEDGIDAVSKTGRTAREAFNLVTTGKADTEGTLAKDRGEVMFDYDGDGQPGGPVGEGLTKFDPVGNAAEEAGEKLREVLP